MSQNEPRDGRWALDELDEIVWLDVEGYEVPLTEIHHAGTPYNVAVRAKAALRDLIRPADGTEPVAPGERPEVAFARSTEDGRTIRAEDTVRGWLLTEGEDMGDGEFVNGSRLCWITNDQARTLAAAWLPLADWETADAAPGSGGQTGTPGADGGAADGSEQST